MQFLFCMELHFASNYIALQYKNSCTKRHVDNSALIRPLLRHHHIKIQLLWWSHSSFAFHILLWNFQLRVDMICVNKCFPILNHCKKFRSAAINFKVFFVRLDFFNQLRVTDKSSFFSYFSPFFLPFHFLLTWKPHYLVEDIKRLNVSKVTNCSTTSFLKSFFVTS